MSGMDEGTFERTAGTAALIVAALGLGYSVVFAVYVEKGYKWAATTSSELLLLGGLVSTIVVVALYQRLRAVEPSFALLAFVLGTLAAAGAFLHGGYDFALLVKGATGSGLAASPIDPRGALVFGVSGIAVGLWGWLILSGGRFRRIIGQLAIADLVLLLTVYLGRLFILNPKNPLLAAAAVLSGFVVNPAFYIGVGMELRAPSPSPSVLKP